jgi:predicted thioesterase
MEDEMEELKVGTSFEKKFFVNKEDTALALGSGGEAVLATPRLDGKYGL